MATSPGTGWRDWMRNRGGWWLVAAASAVALSASWQWWALERAAVQRLQRAQQGQAALAPLQTRVSERIKDWERLRTNSETAQKILERTGSMPEPWEHRSITIEGQRMSRAEAEQYLVGLQTTQDSLFLPSAILLKAARPGESVFVPHQGLDAPDALMVTIKADLYTRAAP